MKSLLVIDDEQPILDAMDMILTDMGYDVTISSDALKGESLGRERDFDLILVDIQMPDKNGAEIVKSILSEKPEAKILVITGYPGDPLVQRALHSGARGLVKKPFEIGKILDFLQDRENHE